MTKKIIKIIKTIMCIYYQLNIIIELCIQNLLTISCSVEVDLKEPVITEAYVIGVWQVLQNYFGMFALQISPKLAILIQNYFKLI